jgi:small subunit ribosomal protein S8
MTVNCLVNDMLVRIRNAIIRRHPTVKVLKSKFCVEILKFFATRGIIRYLDASDTYFIEVGIKYVSNRSVIRRIEQISTPSRRKFVSFRELRKDYPGGAFLVVSTKKGLLLREQALDFRVGGMVICIIYF